MAQRQAPEVSCRRTRSADIADRVRMPASIRNQPNRMLDHLQRNAGPAPFFGNAAVGPARTRSTLRMGTQQSFHFTDVELSFRSFADGLFSPLIRARTIADANEIRGTAVVHPGAVAQPGATVCQLKQLLFPGLMRVYTRVTS